MVIALVSLWVICALGLIIAGVVAVIRGSLKANGFVGEGMCDREE